MGPIDDPLATTPFDHALLDPGLGLLFAADGVPERAYPRLFHAARQYPEALIQEPPRTTPAELVPGQAEPSSGAPS